LPETVGEKKEKTLEGPKSVIGPQKSTNHPHIFKKDHPQESWGDERGRKSEELLSQLDKRAENLQLILSFGIITTIPYIKKKADMGRKP